MFAKEHKEIVKEIDEELARRGVKDPLESYFRNTLKSVLKEAVRRGLIKEDQKVKELIE